MQPIRDALNNRLKDIAGFDYTVKTELWGWNKDYFQQLAEYKRKHEHWTSNMVNGEINPILRRFPTFCSPFSSTAFHFDSQSTQILVYTQTQTFRNVSLIPRRFLLHFRRPACPTNMPGLLVLAIDVWLILLGETKPLSSRHINMVYVVFIVDYAR